MKKIIFTAKPHSVIDVITNSSSELFVGEHQSEEALIELIEAMYPNYLDEYEELKSIDKLTIEELNIYIDYVTYPHTYSAKKSEYNVLPGFEFDELFEPKRNFKTGEVITAHNGEIQYELKRNNEYDFVTEDNFKDVKNRIDPDRQMYFLFSLDQNPNWKYQENLMDIMKRHHLG